MPWYLAAVVYRTVICLAVCVSSCATVNLLNNQSASSQHSRQLTTLTVIVHVVCTHTHTHTHARTHTHTHTHTHYPGSSWQQLNQPVNIGTCSVGVCWQVDLMYDIENNLPKFIQRKVHVKRAVVKPNEGTASFIQKVLYPLNFFFWGGDISLPVVKSGEYLACVRYCQLYSAGGSSNVASNICWAYLFHFCFWCHHCSLLF